MWGPNETIADKGCDIDDKLAFIAHGWKENINVPWAKHLIGNLTEIRGGCTIFIDYHFYGVNPNYLSFLSHFKKISALVTSKLKMLDSEGFKPENWYMFGHSAGARLVIDAAANYGYKKVNQIDGE